MSLLPRVLSQFRPIRLLFLAWIFLHIHAARAQTPPPLPPFDLPGLSYTNAFFQDADLNPNIPPPSQILGFPIGRRAVTTQEIETCLRAWASAAPDRVRLVEYARSHEGRALHYLVISSPQNHSRLHEIQSDLNLLADPRALSEAGAEQLLTTLPAVAWLAYCIHGDETEGSDAALALIHYLIADQRPETKSLLQDLVIIIDPVQNPDGRDRFLKMIAEHRGSSPNVDNQSLLHQGYWPRGRHNHYLFDLNRDWIFATQPETQGRLREVARWNPLLFVDAHGMSGEDTYLFSPPREPMNPHFPPKMTHWGRVFARDQARAFDALGWVYYTGEWNEGWYPGYSDAWSVFRGAIGILYEVASIGENGVRRPGGRIQTLRESIHQQIVSSLANLRTLQTHAQQRLREFAAERRSNISPTGPYSKRTWAVFPTPNRSRWRQFTVTLQLQGIELHILENEFIAPITIDQLGNTTLQRLLPGGTLLIPNRQPLAPLAAALLEFDPRMSLQALEEERREILRSGNSQIYDTTAWNLTMMHGLEAVTLPQDLPAEAKPFSSDAPPPAPTIPPAPQPVAWIIDGADDRSVAAAGRLLQDGLNVQAAEKPFRLQDRDFSRGAIVITRLHNRDFEGDLASTIIKTAQSLQLAAIPVHEGLGDGDLPDLGGRHFVHLIPPRIAILARGRVNPTDFGSLWHLLDHDLALRHSQIPDADQPPDLDRYNVLLLPDRHAPLPSSWRTPLVSWVKAGGTLIAIAGAAGDLANGANELTRVRRLQDVLDKIAPYERTIFREWLASRPSSFDLPNVWTNRVAASPSYPWPPRADPPKKEELEDRDAWNRLFMPQGALLASRADSQHWLTAGVGAVLPILAGNQDILMAADSVETPVRFGVFTPAADAPAQASRAAGKNDSDAKPAPRRAGWSGNPDGQDLLLRMSGLLWPEAAQRIAHSAVVTRESLGRGQVILFASPPNFRAASKGAARLLSNALVLGPGFGTSQPIHP